MPSIKFTDGEIAELLNERKQLPPRWERRLLVLRMAKEYSQRRSHLIVRGQRGEFQIFVRQNTINNLGFSIGVAFRRKKETSWFILKRYNGRHASAHITRRAGKPKEKIRTMHVHIATVEGQSRGNDLMYAEPTSSYTDVYSAIEFALKDSHFEKPTTEDDRNPAQGRLSLMKKNNDGSDH